MGVKEILRRIVLWASPATQDDWNGEPGDEFRKRLRDLSKDSMNYGAQERQRLMNSLKWKSGPMETERALLEATERENARTMGALQRAEARRAEAEAALLEEEAEEKRISNEEHRARAFESLMRILRTNGLAMGVKQAGAFLKVDVVSSNSISESALPAGTAPPRPRKLFFSYSHKDETLRDELAKHLSMLVRERVVSAWHDRCIGPGRPWAGEIDAELNAADIILLLLSADFMASNYCYDVEAGRALERHARGEAVVIPILLRGVDWGESPIAELQALPKDGRPVIEWPNRDAAFKEIALAIRRVVQKK